MFPNSLLDNALELKALGYLINNKETDFYELKPIDFAHTVHRRIFQDLTAGTVFSYQKLLDFGMSKDSAVSVFESDVYSSAEMDKISKQIRTLSLARRKFHDATVLCQKLTACPPSELSNFVGDVGLRDQTYTPLKARENAKNLILSHSVDFEPRSIRDSLEYFSPGWVCGIAASTGVGKTSAAIQISRSISEIEKSFSLYVSLEMPLVNYLERALSLKFYESPDHDWIEWQRFRKTITGNVLQQSVSDHEIIIDKPNLTVSEIKIQARKIISQGINLKTIVIDHFHILRPESAKLDENANHHSAIIALDQLAKELNVRVLCLFQTRKKQGDNRFDEPFESDISGSKSIVNQLWWLLMLWRQKDNQDVINFKIAKRRDGRGVGDKGQINVRGTYMFDSLVEQELWYNGH